MQKKSTQRNSRAFGANTHFRKVFSISLIMVFSFAQLFAGSISGSNPLHSKSNNTMVTANAGPNDSNCGLSYQLNATIPSSGTGTWTSLYNPGVSFAPSANNPNATVTIAMYDTNMVGIPINTDVILRWTVVDSTGSAFDDVTITFLVLPVIDAGYNDSVCGSSALLTAYLLYGTGSWTGPTGVLFGNPSSPQTSADISFGGMSEISKTYTFEATNGSCSASDSLIVAYSAIPNAAAGMDDYTCGTSYTFDADILGSEFALGTWESDFATAVFNDKHDPNATVALPNTGSFPGQPQGGTFGDSSYVLIPFNWIMDNNHCNDTDEVVITFYQHPVAYAGPDTAVCGKIYNMIGNYSIGASTGHWTVISAPTAIPPIWSDVTDPQSTVQVPLHGQYTFKWKEDNLHNQTCTSFDLVIVYFIEIPEPDAGPDRYVCGNSTYLEALPSTGNGQWLPCQAQITNFMDPHSFTHYGLTGSNDTVTYIWLEYNEYQGIQCASSSEVNIVFMIVPDANVFFTPGLSTDHICGKTETSLDNILVAAAPGISGYNVSAYWDCDDATFYPNAFATDPDSVQVGNYGIHKFNWVVENHLGDSICPDSSISIYVDFIEQPTVNAGPLYDTTCDPQYSLQAEFSTSTGNPKGMWIIASPNFNFWQHTSAGLIPVDTIFPTTIHDIVAMPDSINQTTTETFELIWQEFNFGSWNNGNPPDFCTDLGTTTVTFAPTLLPIAGSDTTIELAFYDLDGSLGSPYIQAYWELVSAPSGATAIISDPNNLTTQIELSDYGYYTFNLTGTNDYCEVSDEVIIHYVDSLNSIEGQTITNNYQLYQNVPNPFNQTTEIKFYIPETTDIEIAIYSLLGKKVEVVANQKFEKGQQSISVDVSLLAPGTYLYSLQSKRNKLVRKMCIVR
ncbi:MAG: T9SS type A sorting domain-containing protein [Bacteroidales bacterium]|nr:T9SS type A sorting domain-containing protein [Bacteroidales bacterium]MCF8457090.1 T9SS type A sorting domain-containing protein [Bacteroidales bacterium]